MFVVTSNLAGLFPEGWAPMGLVALPMSHPRALSACPLSGSLPGHSSVAPGPGHLEQSRSLKLCKAFNAGMFHYIAFKTIFANYSVDFIKFVGSHALTHCGRQIWGFYILTLGRKPKLYSSSNINPGYFP